MLGAISPRRAAATFFDPPCSPRLIYRAIREGLLQSHAVGRRSYILRSDLEKFIAEQPSPQSPQRAAA